MKIREASILLIGILVGAGVTLGAVRWSNEQSGSGKVVLENAQVRVKDVVFPPGDTSLPMHTHDLPHVGVIIEGGTLDLVSPDGSVERLQLEAGDVGYREANVTHRGVNRGATPIRVIEVEIK